MTWPGIWDRDEGCGLKESVLQVYANIEAGERRQEHWSILCRATRSLADGGRFCCGFDPAARAKLRQLTREHKKSADRSPVQLCHLAYAVFCCGDRP